MTTKKLNISKSILIPDGEHPFLMRVAYCLSQHRHVKIYIMSKTRRFPMRYSRLIHHISYIKKSTKRDWVGHINEIVESYNIDVIMPVSEDGIKALITYKSLINNKERLVNLPTLNSYEKALDKSELAKHLSANNIPHPRTLIYKSGDLLLDISTIGFPAIAKPIHGFGGEGIYVLKNDLDLEMFKVNKSKAPSFVIQEFIDGYDIDCSLLCNEGELLAYTIQKGTLFGNKKFAPAIGLHFLKNEQLLETVKALVSKLEWSGVAHIDLRYDSKSKDFKVIEINGRFWSSVEASLAAGVNFPYLYGFGFNSTNDNVYRSIDYLNLKGLFKTILKKPSTIFRFSFIKHYTPLLFMIKDPMPVLAMFFNKLRNSF